MYIGLLKMAGDSFILLFYLDLICQRVDLFSIPRGRHLSLIASLYASVFPAVRKEVLCTL
jgi:hypothetical protein